MCDVSQAIITLGTSSLEKQAILYCKSLTKKIVWCENCENVKMWKCENITMLNVIMWRYEDVITWNREL
jgi:hypothetical protein